MRKFTLIIFYLTAALLIASCGSSIDSTDNRYKHTTDEEKIVTKERPVSTLIEDFDFTPYLMTIEKSKAVGFTSTQPQDSLWRNYPKIDNSKKVTVRQPGFRVQVLATDDLMEAQQMRSDVYFKTNKNDIYISFQPPLYKVKVGDYETHSGANNLAFKLNQLGFSPTQVVADTVNLQK
ncbi:MAG: SPOR domain-containing protein [Ignavibacteriaceae bacterium]